MSVKRTARAREAARLIDRLAGAHYLAAMSSILVTGASRGIGFEFVRQYDEQGWRVFATCRDPSSADRLQAIAEGSEGRVSVHALDVTNHPQIEALAEELGHEAIDILVNNAGFGWAPPGAGPHFETFGNTSYERWAAVMQTNLFGVMKVSETFVEHVARSERRIIAALSSALASVTNAEADDCHIYRTSKAGVNMLVKVMSAYLRDRGIITVALSPGWVSTEMGTAAAIVKVEDSIRAMRGILDGLTQAESGQYIRYDGSRTPY